MAPFVPSWKRKLLGGVLILLGIAGLVLPILQGSLFLLLAVFVLRDQYGWSRRCLAWADRRFPGKLPLVERLETRLLDRCQRCGQWCRRQLGLRQG